MPGSCCGGSAANQFRRKEYRDDESGAGKKVAEWRGINLDLDCKASVVLATFEEGKPVHLRCPKLLTLNPLSRYPFAPWPDYQDIESEELAGLVVQVSKEAKELN